MLKSFAIIVSLCVIAQTVIIPEHGTNPPAWNPVRNLDAKVQISPDELRQIQQVSSVENLHLVKNAEEIIHRGLADIRRKVDDLSEITVKPDEADWQKLNESINDFFRTQYKNLELKQNSENDANEVIIQNIVVTFRGLVDDFLEKFQSRANSSKQRPGGIVPTVVGQVVSSGVQQVVNNISNLGQGSTTQPPRPGIFGNVISSVQQFFVRNQTEATTSSTTSAPGFFQGAFSQVFSNFRPTTPTTTTTTTTTTTPRHPIELIQENIANVLSQNNIFRQSTRQPEDEKITTTQQPNLIQNIGQALQNANPFKPQSQAQQDHKINENVMTGNPVDMFVCFNLAKITNRNRSS